MIMHPKTSLDFEEDASICEHTGALTRTFTVEGIKCPKIVLSDRLSKKQAGYTLIDMDLQDVKTWLAQSYSLCGPAEKIPENSATRRTKYALSDDVFSSGIVKALWFSAIVVYAKCFTQTDGRGIKLERRNIPEHMRSCHDKIMKYRNTIVAHAGETHLERADLELILSPPSKKKSFMLRNNCARVDFEDDRNEIVSFSDLINRIHSDVIDKRRTLTAKIKEDMRKVSGKTLYENAE